MSARPGPFRSLRRCAVIVAACALCACEEDRRVLHVYGGLQSVAGSEGGTREDPRPVDREKPSRKRADAPGAPGAPGTPGTPDENLRVRQDDGTIRLVSRNPREMMFHLRKTLQDDERDLLLREVLSEQTKKNYRALGRDPAEAMRFLLQHKEDVVRLLQQFPMGEVTPGFFVQNIGPSQFRLEVPPGRVDPPLEFSRLDYVFENGACRLLLIS